MELWRQQRVSSYPLPARYRIWVPSSQKGMQTPEMESRISNPLSGSLAALISQRPSWRSLILEKPVVAILSFSPIQTARLFFAPPWPWPSCTGFSERTSQIRSFLSRQVVTSREPLALNERDCTISGCLRVSFVWPCSTSQNLTK